ncbi:hypothetical protein NFI96_024059 [Prochilodus magdalenae]|nr:hypothetical protein NFI96_024059 [Prochilodus magdalenae]
MKQTACFQFQVDMSGPIPSSLPKQDCLFKEKDNSEAMLEFQVDLHNGISSSEW